jgi:hypothetical protein
LNVEREPPNGLYYWRMADLPVQKEPPPVMRPVHAMLDPANFIGTLFCAINIGIPKISVTEKKVAITDYIFILLITIVAPKKTACHCAIHATIGSTSPTNTQRMRVEKSCNLMKKNTYFIH